MKRNLNDLDGGIIAGLDIGILRQREVVETHCSRERIGAGADDLHHGRDDVCHIGRLGAKTHVYVEEGRGMASVPAGNDGECASRYRPVRAVLGYSQAAACGVNMSVFVFFIQNERQSRRAYMDSPIACHPSECSLARQDTQSESARRPSAASPSPTQRRASSTVLFEP